VSAEGLESAKKRSFRFPTSLTSRDGLFSVMEGFSRFLGKSAASGRSSNPSPVSSKQFETEIVLKAQDLFCEPLGSAVVVEFLGEDNDVP
jgi:hypothetical protein